MTGEKNPGHAQHVLNAFADKILREDIGFDGFSIHTVPRYNPASMKPPFIHVTADDTTYNDLGYQDIYSYVLKISLVMVIPHHQIQNRNRSVHRWEEIIQDSMIANRQVDLREHGLRMEQWNINKAWYILEPEDLQLRGIDSLLMDITAKYDRTVPS